MKKIILIFLVSTSIFAQQYQDPEDQWYVWWSEKGWGKADYGGVTRTPCPVFYEEISPEKLDEIIWRDYDCIPYNIQEGLIYTGTILKLHKNGAFRGDQIRRLMLSTINYSVPFVVATLPDPGGSKYDNKRHYYVYILPFEENQKWETPEEKWAVFYFLDEDYSERIPYDK